MHNFSVEVLVSNINNYSGTNILCIPGFCPFWTLTVCQVVLEALCIDI